MNLAPAQSADLAHSLKRDIEGDVLCDQTSRMLYSTDASIYQVEPVGVVLPKTVDDVVAVHDWARRLGLAIIPRGSGTSLSGQSIGRGIVLDFSKHFQRILEIDAQRLTARVQPGVVLDALNAALAKHRLQFGPDVATSSRANLGGMIGNNSAGARSIWHGKTVDSLIEAEVVLADGTRTWLGPATAAAAADLAARTDRIGAIHRELSRIAETEREEILARFPRILRRVSGYNLDELIADFRLLIPTPRHVAAMREREAAQYRDATINPAKLIAGAEGSLATVTEALVHVLPLPAARGVVVLHFDSLTASVAAVDAILACDPSAAELLDGLIIRLARRSLEYRHYLDFVVGDPASLVLVEFSADSAEEVARRAAQLRERLQGCPGLTHTLVALDKRQYEHIWACRKASLPLLLGQPGARKPVAFVEDAAVDPRRLPEFVARFQELLARHGVDGAFYGHASVGCLHIRPMLDLKTAPDIRRLEQISAEVCELALEFGGAMSGEHGDGMARSYLNERLFGPRLYRAFQAVKAAFDPENRLNPGKVVNGPSPIENLRYGENYRTLPIATTLDFSRQGGFAAAAELCNGAGVCRKLRTGTMCPSFMATGDEEHSTRGRANALRLALSGALPASEWTSPRMFDTFDLCLQCKGCKAECPSNVDVAKLKMEFLDHYHRRHGAPLSARLMANAAELNRVGAALAPLSNWATRLPGAAWLGEKLFGLDRRRPLPRFSRNHFRKWFEKRRARAATSPSRGPVLLLDDCLTSYCEPGVNRAAVELLEAAGYEVRLAGLECCGRTHASGGFLEQAKLIAQRNLALLEPWAKRGAPIVATEPSCLSMLIDDYLDLVPGERSRVVAAQSMQVESLLARDPDALRFDTQPRESGQSRKLLLHGHCHQKALVGVAETNAVLAKLPGAEIELVDSGCCGMAGSFGYQHYDLSMKIGERVLFPAVRAANDATIVAPGFSCRSQIAHGAGRQALHPVEILAGQLPRDCDALQ